MPKTSIESPVASTTVDRLALGAEKVRGADVSSNPSMGCYCSCACFEAEASSFTCSCLCFEAEASTYAAGCAACCCFETE